MWPLESIWSSVSPTSPQKTSWSPSGSVDAGDVGNTTVGWAPIRRRAWADITGWRTEAGAGRSGAAAATDCRSGGEVFCYSGPEKRSGGIKAVRLVC